MENNKFLPSDLMSSSPNSLTEGPRRLIPKVIHYCWFGPKPFSRTVRKCIATWHKHLPDYQFCLWNEETCANYAAEHNLLNPMGHSFVKGAYAAKKYAFVADYVRFWALCHCGGVYLDTDMYVVRSFDDLLDAEFFCGWETAEGNADTDVERIVSCGALGACALGACAREILAKYDMLTFDAEHLDKFVVPRIITPIVLKQENVVILPYDSFYPLPYNERFVWRKMKYNTANTYAVHLWDISWGKWHISLQNRLLFYYKQIIRK